MFATLLLQVMDVDLRHKISVKSQISIQFFGPRVLRCNEFANTNHDLVSDGDSAEQSSAGQTHEEPVAIAAEEFFVRFYRCLCPTLLVFVN